MNKLIDLEELDHALGATAEHKVPEELLGVCWEPVLRLVIGPAPQGAGVGLAYTW